MLLEHGSSSALTPTPAMLCAVVAAQPGMASTHRAPPGKWKRSFGGVRVSALVTARWSRLHLQGRLGTCPSQLAWPLPRCPLSWPGVTMWVRKWEEEEEAVPSSHQGDGGLGHSVCWGVLEATSSFQGCWQSAGLLGPSLCAELAP